jgi:hypothetical protein
MAWRQRYATSIVKGGSQVKKTLLATALFMTAPVLSFAQTDANNYTPIYDCFNAGQANDSAPIVTIVEDASQLQYLLLQTRGSSKYVQLARSRRFVIDSAEFVGPNGITVLERNGVEQPPAGATVVFGSQGLTYSCSPH